MAAGHSFTCGLRGEEGPIYCWGTNYSQNSGYTGQATAPDDDDFVSVSAGYYHACGLHADGRISCWGKNSSGQANPPQTADFAAVTAGDDFTCGLHQSGQVSCWGQNRYGRTDVPDISFDFDDVDDEIDNCPATTNPDQADVDEDGVGDACDLDNCFLLANADQADFDGDGVGDACDDDQDADGVANDEDCNPFDPSDATDYDCDDLMGEDDNYETVANPDQADSDSNGVGDACNNDEDVDGDEWADNRDNCVSEPNPDQADTDQDGVGDACNDTWDFDADEIEDTLDNCPATTNVEQIDTDEDGLGDACDFDCDGLFLANEEGECVSADNYAPDATVDALSYYSSGYGPEMVIDGSPVTEWKSTVYPSAATWLRLDLGEVKQVHVVRLLGVADVEVWGTEDFRCIF